MPMTTTSPVTLLDSGALDGRALDGGTLVGDDLHAAPERDVALDVAGRR
jgi:hypothetical protein